MYSYRGSSVLNDQLGKWGLATDLCYIQNHVIPLIGKDGDEVINNVTCALMGTESISVHRVYMGNMALNRIKRLKSSTKIALAYDLTLVK